MFLGCFQGDGFSATAKTKEELDIIMLKHIKSKHSNLDTITYLINEIDDEGFSKRNINN